MMKMKKVTPRQLVIALAIAVVILPHGHPNSCRLQCEGSRITPRSVVLMPSVHPRKLVLVVK